MTIPGPRSGRIQGRKEIPEAMKRNNGKIGRRQKHGQGEDDDNGIQRGNTYNEVEMRDYKRRKDAYTLQKQKEERKMGVVIEVYFF